MSAERLYTPQLLAAAVELAKWPPLANAGFHGSAKSPTCGSTVEIDISVNSRGLIDALGLRVRACAVGQAAAAIFARHAQGRDLQQLIGIQDRFSAWLEDEAPAPEWPDLTLIAPARNYRGRHGAMLLPWNAAIAALSSAPSAR